MGSLSLEHLSQKEWARSDKWNVRFSSGKNPKGYTDWLPATDVSLPIRTVSSYEFASGHRTFGIPKSMDYPAISLAMVDDDSRTITKFLEEWYNEMFPENGTTGVTYLTKAVKTLEIETLNLQNEVVTLDKFIVYPEGSLVVSLNSNSGPVAIPLNFRVVGYIPK
jgi:hypothetical protein